MDIRPNIRLIDYSVNVTEYKYLGDLSGLKRIK